MVLQTPARDTSPARDQQNRFRIVTDITPLRSGRSEGPEPGSAAFPASGAERDGPKVFFARGELDLILSIYGRMVAAGEWRDYAIDGLKESAVFSIFRRSSEMPLYRIEKRPKLARRQGAYAVIAASGQILKRGHDLDNVLKVLERKVLRLIEAD